MQKLVLALLFSIISIFGYGQFSLNIKKISEELIIDGELTEEVWKTAPKADNFQQYFPSDTVAADAISEIQMVYDDDFLYVSVKCYSAGPDWVVNSLKRDFRAGGIDNMTLSFDAFRDNTNAYFFGVNAEGVLREGIISNGGISFQDFDESWDNKWYGQAVKHDDFYSAEMKIPFSSLRFKEGSQVWNFSAYRFDAQYNEWSTWTGVPRNLPLTNLGFAGQLHWEEPLKASNSKVSLIPFVSSGYSRDFENNEDGDFGYEVGGDAKIAVTPGLNLDLTVNPDFSQVEVDRQITDLSRFEIFFPERRQFFLENADLFGAFGFGRINPFFSRRIGVAENKDGDLAQNRIFGGARLSGKVNDNLRVGVLNMQTASDEEAEIDAANFSVVALQQKIWKRSNISFLAVNKQLLGVEESEGVDFIDNYNRVFGVDFNFADESGVWTGKTFAHGSLSPGISGLPIAHGTELNYNTRTWEAGWSHEYVNENYDAQVGFVQRTNFIRINPGVSHNFYPESGFFNNFSVGVNADVQFRPQFGRTDHEISVGLRGQGRQNTRFGFRFAHQYVFLFDDFDPTGTDADPLLANTEYNYLFFEGSYSSDRRQPVSFSVSPYIGQYFNGHRIGFRNNVTFISKPKASVSVDFNYNWFTLPHLEENPQTFLVGPRIDYTFSKKLFFTTFIQFNTQSQNTNINARLQWRFAPVSDFFLVYTDNYFTGNDPVSDRFNLDIRNRAIVAKFTYWLNL